MAPAGRRRRRSGALSALALVAAGVAFLPAAVGSARTRDVTRSITRIGLLDNGSQPDLSTTPAITPDGRYVAYIASVQVQAVAFHATPGPTPIPHGELASARSGPAQSGMVQSEAASDAVRYCSRFSPSAASAPVARRAVAIPGFIPFLFVVRLDRATGERIDYDPPSSVKILPDTRYRLSISDDGSLAALGDFANVGDGATHTSTVIRWDHVDQPLFVSGGQPWISGDGRSLALEVGTSCTGVLIAKVDGLDNDHDGVPAEGAGDVSQIYTTGPDGSVVDRLAMPVLSADGRTLVLLGSKHSPVNNAPDLHPLQVVDLHQATPTPVKLQAHLPAGGVGDITGGEPSISHDGRVVAFTSDVAYAANDNNGVQDEYVATVGASVPANGVVPVALGSVTAAGAALPHGIAAPGAISPDGGSLAFIATDKVTSDDHNDGLPDVYIRTLANGATELVDTTPAGQAPTHGAVRDVALDNAAQRVAFSSTSQELVSPDDNAGAFDVYLRALTTSTPGTQPTTTTTLVNGSTTTTKAGTEPTTTTSPAGPGVPTTLVLNPPIARPGTVSSAVGTGWAGCPSVTLSWVSNGVSRPAGSVATGGADRFAVPVVVFGHEPLGPRTMVASCAGKADASAPFLVVPGSVQPSHFLGRR